MYFMMSVFVSLWHKKQLNFAKKKKKKDYIVNTVNTDFCSKLTFSMKILNLSFWLALKRNILDIEKVQIFAKPPYRGLRTYRELSS